MNNLDIYNAVKEVPDNAKRKIQGGRLSGKTDINPMWRIKSLTSQFGPCGIGWYYKTVNKWLERYGEEIVAFVDIELYIKVNGEWSMPICGTGGNMFAEKEKSGIHVSDECYKMATTDAISVACKQIGIGADVYWESDKTKYGSQSNPSLNEQDYPEHLRDIIRECIRTGVDMEYVLKKYRLKKLDDMSELQHKSCMNVFAQMPNKEVS